VRLPFLDRFLGLLRPRAILAAAQVAAIAWFSPAHGLPLDDAWIHQVVARTFAETGTLGYAPGQHGAAATSYLWAALLAVNLKLFHLDPAFWALLLNTAAALATGQLLLSIVERARPIDVSDEAWSWGTGLVVLGAVISPNILWFVSSGMEALPFAALSLAAIAAVESKPLLSGLAAGALLLLRPEATPLGAILVAESFWRTRKVGTSVRIAAPWILAGLLYAGSNLLKAGHALPSTLTGRRWLWFEMSFGVGSVDRIFDFLDAWTLRLGSYTIDTSGFLVWFLVGLAGYGALRLARGRAAVIAFVWALFHAAFYALMLPTPGHGGRYQPLTPLFFALCMPVGLALLLRELVRYFNRQEKLPYILYAATGIVPLIALALPAASTLKRANMLAVAHIETTEVGAGKYIRTLPQGPIASFDIGAQGWYAGRPILDLGGLSDPSVAGLLEAGRASSWLRDNHVKYIVLPQGYEGVLPDFEDFTWRLHLRENESISLTPIRAFETPFDKWTPAIKATWNAAPKQIVFEVSYPDKPGPRVVPVIPNSDRVEIQDHASLIDRRERMIAEHMLAVLAQWGLSARIEPSAEPREAKASDCFVTFGGWGFDASDACGANLKPTLYEEAGRYTEIGDLGGAIRAIPHLIAKNRRRTDPTFHPPLAPTSPPFPNGVREPASNAARFGLALFALALLVAGGIDLASRRRGLAAMAAMVLCACSQPSDAISAMKEGRGALTAALERGASATDAGGRAPIISAAHLNDAEAMATLLKYGADPTVKDQNGVTALQVAARNNNPACVAELVSALRARQHTLDDRAGTRARSALLDAAINGNLETVTLLVEGGADVNVQDTFGVTPLHALAPIDGNRATPIASLLLIHGANPARLDARGFTVLHAAAMTDNVPLITLLGSDAPLEATTPAGETAYDVAMRYHRDRAAEALLAIGAIPRSEPPLFGAARMDAVERIAALRAVGADVARIWEGHTATEVAQKYDSQRALALLKAP
jgi:hypothetical protein